MQATHHQAVPGVLRPQVGIYTQPGRAALNDSFWSHVDLLGDCWGWTGASTEWGYGKLRAFGHDFMAHRCVFELFYGQLPEGALVLHRCDNPPCVRPEHLFMGTAKDNTQDMIRKGRAGRIGPRGEQNRHARLTEAEVLALREAFAAGATPTELGGRFNISSSYVNRIIRGQTWGHVGGPICVRDRRGEHRKVA